MNQIYLRLFLYVFFTLSFLTGFIGKVNANHAMGADLSYQCVDSVNRIYSIRVNFYRDCAGTAAPDRLILYITSSCDTQRTVFLNKLPCGPAFVGQLCEISPFCNSYLEQSTCNGGQLPGIQAFSYSGLVTLSRACADWTFTIGILARNTSITNLQDPINQYLYTYATLDNQVVANNSSPFFTNLPVPVICSNQPFFYNQGTVDADGDSLVFRLEAPMTNSAQPISYQFPFSPTNPMATVNGFGFDSLTGQMSFIPKQQQVAVVAVLVEEYRYGKLIGTTRRDMEFIVADLPSCANPIPQFTGTIGNTVAGGVVIDSSHIQACPGNSLSFTTSAFSRSGDSVYLSSNLSSIIPQARLITSYVRKDSLIANFSWDTIKAAPGRYTLVITVKNNGCPLLSTQAFAITIDVISGTNAGPDRIYCSPGDPVPLNARGGNQFSWTPSAGLSRVDVGNPTAAPDKTTAYVVSSNMGVGCQNADTVLVSVMDFKVGLNPASDTICKGASIELNATPGYVYQWESASGLSCNNCSAPQAAPQTSATYYVQISDSTGFCQMEDSAVITVLDFSVTPAFSDTTVSGGDAVTLEIKITGGNGTNTYLWSPPEYLDDVNAPKPTSRPLSSITYLVTVSSGPCVDTASIRVHTDLPPRLVEIPSAFTPNNDGKNDRFGPIIFNQVGTVRTFRIYNRWGALVHDSTDEWDGLWDGKEQATGTYMYYIEISIPALQDLKFDGSVSLLR